MYGFLPLFSSHVLLGMIYKTICFANTWRVGTTSRPVSGPVYNPNSLGERKNIYLSIERGRERERERGEREREREGEREKD